MRIGIDYTPAVRQRQGIGRYSRGLIGALARLDHENSYVLLYPAADRGPSPLFPNRHNFVERPIAFSDRTLAIIWHRLKLPVPVDWLTGRLDLFHSLDFTLPPLRQGLGIVTIHDLSFLVHSECAEANLSAYLERAVPAAVRRASMVIADSHHTRSDLICLLDVAPERVEVLHCGVEPRFRRVTDEAVLQAARARYGLERPFIFWIGMIEPRKNLVRLVRAYAALRDRGDIPHQLVIAGGRGWLYEEVFRTVEELRLADAIRFLGYVPDEDLPTLYTLADVFAFPSIYEGFGLPPLEAMACGTPVVTSNTSSLPEVVGDAAITVDPMDVEALADALSLAIGDQALRHHLSAAGHARAAEFTWERAGKRLLSIYRRALEIGAA